MDLKENSALLSKSVKEKLGNAGNVVQGQIKQFIVTAKNGNASIRGLALISGFALVISSCSQIVTSVWKFHPTAVLIAFYSLFMGSAAIAMEVDPQALVRPKSSLRSCYHRYSQIEDHE